MGGILDIGIRVHSRVKSSHHVGIVLFVCQYSNSMSNSSIVFGLTTSSMRVDACISSRSSQIFIFSIGYMKTGLWVAVFLGEPKINHIDLVALFTNIHQKVIWFNVAVYKIVGMNQFQPLYLEPRP